VDEAGGGGGHTGDDGTLRNLTLGEAGMDLLAGLGDLGEEQLRKNIVIHGKYLGFIIYQFTITFSERIVNFLVG
jgi:hypothetical protein